MSEDDVEAVLAGLEQRLHALQAELEEDGAPAAFAPPAGPASSPPPPPPSPPSPPAAALERFGEDLRRSTRELVAAFDRALAEARGLPAGDALLFRDEVALEAEASLRQLCELGAALERIAGIGPVDLRAYAGGHAALDLTLDGAVALVDELRRALPRPFSVVEARQGHLAIQIDRS